MSRQATLDRIQNLKLEVLGLTAADGLAGLDWSGPEIMAVAQRLEMIGKRLEAAGKREPGTRFTPPDRQDQPDYRERQLPRGDI